MINAYKKWRMCGRKKPFYTQSKANKFARHRNMNVYECPVCHCWHVSTRKKK